MPVTCTIIAKDEGDRIERCILAVRDFVDEVATELRRAARSLTQNRDRLAVLEELREVAVVLAAELGRPITVFDVIRSAPTSNERERRIQLVRHLRSTAEETDSDPKEER